MLMIYGRGKGGAWSKAVDHGGFYTVVALEICISPVCMKRTINVMGQSRHKNSFYGNCGTHTHKESLTLPSQI
jgi:hypothetical protein